MATTSPYLPSYMNADSLVISPASVQATDGTALATLAGRQGEMLVSSVHSRLGVMAHRHAVFGASAGTAAQAIAVNTTTSGAVFTLVNPAGSGKNAELSCISLNFLDTNAAPATANVIGLSVVNNGVNAISGITKMPDPVAAGGHALDFSGVAPACYVASVITYASALTVAANFERALWSFPASWVPTVGGSPVPYIYDFNAYPFVLPPGWSVSLLASTAWGSNTVVPSIAWMEYLI